LSVTLEKHQDQCVLRFQGECKVSAAGEIKQALLEALAAGGDIHLDCQNVDEVDLAIVQLLWAAEREARRKDRPFGCRMSDTVQKCFEEAGFQQFPGCDVEE
jgi:anti-anti-sigma factor